jgi:hypothetical protein
MRDHRCKQVSCKLSRPLKCLMSRHSEVLSSLDRSGIQKPCCHKTPNPEPLKKSRSLTHKDLFRKMSWTTLRGYSIPGQIYELKINQCLNSKQEQYNTPDNQVNDLPSSSATKTGCNFYKNVTISLPICYLNYSSVYIHAQHITCSPSLY